VVPVPATEHRSGQWSRVCVRSCSFIRKKWLSIHTLRQLHTEAVVLSAVIRNKLALERTSNSAADRARLTQEISDLNRRLADDRLRALLEAALLKRQRDIRAGKAFPGTEITLL